MFKCETLPCSSHEKLIKATDTSIGFTAFLAIHSTNLGPAAGGLRMKVYENEEEAKQDALALSQAMSFKAAAADIPLGGGKSVLIGNPYTEKSDEKFLAFAQALNHLNGNYFVAEDMGITPQDLAIIAQESDYVCGLDEGQFASGDPSPVTALGVFNAIKTAAKHRLDRTEIKDLVVAVQGLGHVGAYLCDLLHDHGAKLIVTDIRPELAKDIGQKYQAQTVGLENIYDVQADIFAPCAIGGIINSNRINRLKVKIIAGAANNQLECPKTDAQLLMQKQILYAPDYVANGAGIINATAEILKIEDRDHWVEDKIQALKNTLDGIFHTARLKDLSPAVIADQLVH